MIKKYKFIISICIVAIFCNTIVKIFIIDKQVDKISILQQTIAAARSDSYRKTGKIEKQLYAEQDDIKKIMQNIPEEFSFTEYASKIRTLIDKNDLFVEDSLIFRPEEIQKPDLLKYNTNIIVTGDYGKIKKLISDIQNLPGLITLNSARISRTKDNQDTIRLNLEISIFFKRETA